MAFIMYLGTQVHDEGNYEAKMVNLFFASTQIQHHGIWSSTVVTDRDHSKNFCPKRKILNRSGGGPNHAKNAEESPKEASPAGAARSRL